MLVALDSNVFLYALLDQAPYAEQAIYVLRSVERGDKRALFSSLAYAEVLGYKKTQSGIQKAHAFLDEMQNTYAVPLDRDISKRAGIIRMNHPSLRLADSIHLATAMGLASLFVTQDKKLAKIASKYIETMTLHDVLSSGF